MGTFLRPKELLSAREKCQNGEISKDELRAVEDKYIIDLVKKQNQNGFKSITDGDFRRGHWFVDFLCGLEGVSMHYETSPDGFDAPVLEVVGYGSYDYPSDAGNWDCQAASVSAGMNFSKVWESQRQRSAYLRLHYFTLEQQRHLRSPKPHTPKAMHMVPPSSSIWRPVTAPS